MDAAERAGFGLRRRPARVVLLVVTSLVGLAALSGTAASRPAATDLTASSSTPPFRDGTVLVGFRDGVTAADQRSAEQAADPSARENRVVGRTHVLAVPAGHVQEAISRLKRHGAVRFAEPDFVGELAATPNDPSFPLQWPLLNTGQAVGGVAGTPGADERATTAWGVTTGSRSVVVGVVDTGVDYNHPDLAAAVWRNPGNVNGCPAGSRGYNAITGACDALDDDTVYNGHGTHVAGIIGATGNNGVGVTGVSWSTTVLPVKTVTGDGVGATSNLISGLDWLVRAKQAGVNIRVVNDSQTWRGTAYSQALVDEIDVLGRNGILFVTAGGNTSDDNDDPALRRYPCGYDRSNAICAAATTQSDTKASYANAGATTVDVGAPGDNVYSTLRGGRYGIVSGSSMAAAEVSGTAALALAAQPSLTTLALKAAILQGADRVGSLSGLVRTGARLSTCAAVAGCSSTTQPGPVTAGTTTVGGSSDTMSADRKRANRISLPSAGTMARLSVYLQPASSGSQLLTGFVYADQGGAPGALLGTTSSITYSSSSAPGWYPLTFPTAVPLAAGTYWVGVLSGGSSGVAGFRYTSVAAARTWNGNVATSGPSNPFGAASVDNEQMSLYATWTPSTSATGVPFAVTPPGVTATGAAAPAPTQGQLVTAIAGDWTGEPTSTRFQWERCSSTGSACNPITGAAASSYVPVQADVGMTLQARVTATSAGGSATSASPPSMVVRPGSTTTQAFGMTTVGANSDSMVADRKRVNVATLGVSASVTSLTMYLAPTATNGSQSLTGVIYADASGTPGALLARTSGLTFTSQSAAGWYGLPLASPVALSPGRYWIGVQSGGTSGVTGFRWTSAPSSRALSTDAASDGPSNPFGAATFDAEQMSVYATYR